MIDVLIFLVACAFIGGALGFLLDERIRPRIK